MTNVEAAQHLREALDGQFRGAFGAWREAVEKAIAVLEYQPDNKEDTLQPEPPFNPTMPYAAALQCINCGTVMDVQKAICTCGSTELHVIRFIAGAIGSKEKTEDGDSGGEARGD